MKQNILNSLNSTTYLGEYQQESKTFNDYRDTIKAIFKLSKNYFKDLLEPNKFNKNLNLMSEFDYYEFIKSLPYKEDFKEYVTRCKLLLSLAFTDHYFDCDDRSHLSLCKFELNNYLIGYPRYEFRLHVTGRYENPRHVFAAYRDTKSDSKKWIIFDCTYPYNVYGEYLYNPGYHRIFYYNNGVLKEENHFGKKVY